MFQHDMDFLARFAERLSRLGIEVVFRANYPWIYLDEVNGHRVAEKRNSDYGFTVAFIPIRIDGRLKVLDLNGTFHVIRQYVQLGNAKK